MSFWYWSVVTDQNSKSLEIEDRMNVEQNIELIIELTIEYIITTERFIASLLWVHWSRSPFFLEISNWFWITLFHIFQLVFQLLNFFIYIWYFLTTFKEEMNPRFNNQFILDAADFIFKNISLTFDSMFFMQSSHLLTQT